MPKLEHPKERVFFSVGDKVCDIQRPEYVYEIISLDVCKYGDNDSGYYWEDVAELILLPEPKKMKTRISQIFRNFVGMNAPIKNESSQFFIDLPLSELPILESPTTLQYYDDKNDHWVCFVKKEWRDERIK